MSTYYDWKNYIDDDELNNVVTVLKKDGIVIFPTETVYGIGGNALSKNAIDKIYFAKKRPRAKAINIMVGKVSDITKYAVIKSKIEEKIIEKFFPGPLTLILNKKEGFGNGFTLEDNTVGVRIPDNKIALSILNNIDFPLIVPSANISNKPSGINVNQIINDFKSSADIIIDGGKIENGISSTIVKVVNDEIIVLRQGSITLDDIKKKIGDVYEF